MLHNALKTLRTFHDDGMRVRNGCTCETARTMWCTETSTLWRKNSMSDRPSTGWLELVSSTHVFVILKFCHSRARVQAHNQQRIQFQRSGTRVLLQPSGGHSRWKHTSATILRAMSRPTKKHHRESHTMINEEEKNRQTRKRVKDGPRPSTQETSFS